MNEAEHAYTQPLYSVASTIPAGVLRYLDGMNLLTKTQALRLSTINAEGWPHAALLSAGEILALPSGKLRFAMLPRPALSPTLRATAG
jgi:hypothetical protein